MYNFQLYCKKKQKMFRNIDNIVIFNRKKLILALKIKKVYDKILINQRLKYDIKKYNYKIEIS